MTCLEKLLACGINQDSDFKLIAQIILESYYLIPYPGEIDLRPRSVNRLFHGGVHAVRVAYNLEMFFALYKKYKPELLLSPAGLPLTDQELLLLKLIALYHDAANISEICADEHNHAEYFQHDLLGIGFSAKILTHFITALREKDAISQEKTLYQKLLHDADCLDILRIVKDFDKQRLDILADLNDCPGFSNELEQIIQNHQVTINFFNTISSSDIMNKLHLECELSENCYQAVLEVYQLLLLKFITLEGFKLGLSVCLDQINLDDISILDLYNRENTPVVQEIIGKFGCPEEEQTIHDPVLSAYTSHGVYIRKLRSSNLLREFAIWKDNQQVLNRYNLHTSQDLQAYIAAQDSREKVLMPAGFKWRPCAYIMHGLPIKLFYGDLGIIIDAQNTTQAAYFYKQDAFSESAANGSFIYQPVTGATKNKNNLMTLQNKLMEMEQRRIGQCMDPNLHYYGLRHLPCNEVLTNLVKDNILGILVIETQQSMEKALLLRGVLGKPFVDLYKYAPEFGLTRINLHNILQFLTPSDDLLPTNDLLSKLTPFVLHNIKEIRVVYNYRFPSKRAEDGILQEESERKYQFKYIQNTQISCTACIQNGLPMITYECTGGLVYTEVTNLLPNIARLYCKYQFKALNDWIQLPRWQTALRSFGMINLAFDFNELDAKPVTVRFCTLVAKSIEEKRNLLKWLLPITNLKHIKTVNQHNFNVRLAKFFLEEIDNVDKFQSHIEFKLSTPAVTTSFFAKQRLRRQDDHFQPDRLPALR